MVLANYEVITRQLAKQVWPSLTRQYELLYHPILLKSYPRYNMYIVVLKNVRLLKRKDAIDETWRIQGLYFVEVWHSREYNMAGCMTQAWQKTQHLSKSFARFNTTVGLSTGLVEVTVASIGFTAIPASCRCPIVQVGCSRRRHVYRGGGRMQN